MPPPWWRASWPPATAEQSKGVSSVKVYSLGAMAYLLVLSSEDYRVVEIPSLRGSSAQDPNQWTYQPQATVQVLGFESSVCHMQVQVQGQQAGARLATALEELECQDADLNVLLLQPGSSTEELLR